MQVDEIQMLGDPLRGAAWTRALLGLPAKQLHLCGNPAALPLIQRIVRETGSSELHSPSVQRMSRLVPGAARQ